MEQKVLMAEERKESSKGANGRLRRAGRIPAVVYGQGKSSSVSIDAAEFGKKFKVISENTIISLDMGKTKVDVLVKDFQEDILTGSVTHIDFYQVSTTKTLHAKVPVHLSGNAAGIREGGQMEHNLHEVEVECLAKDLPHEILVDVSAMGMGASLKLAEIKAPKGVKFLTNAETVVCHVYNPKHISLGEAEAAPAAEASAEAPAPKAEAKK